MLHHIDRLHQIAHKTSRNIIGLMSGTSLDGLDVALCSISGSGVSTRVKLLNFETIPYSESFKDGLRKVFAKKTIDSEYLTALNPKFGITCASEINKCLKKWGVRADEIDLIASHGQTIMHAPARRHQIDGFPDATLQIGDGDHIATHTGIITISDFRQKHLAHGGEGAPLAVYGDYFLYSSDIESRIMLNIGGIANFTYLPAGGNLSDCLVTDTGPGNTLMDAWVKKYFNIKFDENGKVAENGNLQPELLNMLKSHPFFLQSLPKSTGPEDFNLEYVTEAIENTGISYITTEDVLCTLVHLTADSIAESILSTVKDIKTHIYVSGGGAHNNYLMKQLELRLSDHKIIKMQNSEIPGDAKEAVLFALLANECVAGKPYNCKRNNKAIPQVSMGKISFPD